MQVGASTLAGATAGHIIIIIPGILIISGGAITHTMPVTRTDSGTATGMVTPMAAEHRIMATTGLPMIMMMFITDDVVRLAEMAQDNVDLPTTLITEMTGSGQMLQKILQS